MQLFITIYRTLFFYFFVTFSYRVMGKREVGQLGIIDLIVSILIAELVAISIENTNYSILLTMVPIILLVILEILLGFISIKSSKFRNIIQGKPTMIVCDGKINYHQMLKQRYTIDDLLLNMRQYQIKSIEDVEYAFLESNGKLSIFKYEDNLKKGVFPLPIIIDGKIEDKWISKLPYSKKEIYHIFLNNNVDLKNVFYAFYKDKKIFIVNKNKKDTFLSNKYITE